jgi:hypothetical protein
MECPSGLFSYHALNQQGKAHCEEITKAFDFLLNTLRVHCPEGREFSLVKTKLEEGCMFAKKSVAIQPENQANEPNG